MKVGDSILCVSTMFKLFTVNKQYPITNFDQDGNPAVTNDIGNVMYINRTLSTKFYSFK